MKSISKKIRVIVIEDSYKSREAITTILNSHADISVIDTAPNGEEGVKKILTQKPDIVTLDLEMPKMDGFTVLRIIMSKQPLPIIIISSHNNQENIFKALELGALDFILKPGSADTSNLDAIKRTLLNKITTIFKIPEKHISLKNSSKHQKITQNTKPKSYKKKINKNALKVVVIGSSTGGPTALQGLLTSIQPDLPASILIAQHMPAKVTKAFAERLNRICKLQVCEAKEYDVIKPGHVYIAPGGKNMSIDSFNDKYELIITDENDENIYTPSIDILFSSAAQHFKKNVLAVVLTGMGNDGKKGISNIKTEGGYTIAESKESSVIFGMPNEAIESGRVDKVLPLNKIIEEIIDFSHIDIC